MHSRLSANKDRSDTLQSVRQTSLLEKIYSKKAKNAFFAFFLACLFFFSVRYGYGIIDGPKFFWLMAIMAVYMLLDPECRTRVFDFRFYILTVAYFLLGNYQHMFLTGESETYNILPYTWTVPTVYILGRLIVGNKKSEIEHRTFTVLAVLAAGTYIQGILNYLGYFKYTSYEGIVSAVPWRSFWNPATDGTRNNWNNGFLIATAALFIAVLYRKQYKKIFYMVITLSVVSAVINVAFGGRTMPLLIIFVFGIMAVLHIIANYSNLTNSTKRKILFIFIGIAFFAGVAYIIFINNVFGLADFYKSSDYLTRSGGILKNVRLQMWCQGIARAWKLQKGGWDLYDVNILPTAHNTWIEFARYYDIIISILMIIFVVTVMITGIKTLLKHGGAYPVLYFAVAGQIALFVFSMIEPGYIQNQDLLLIFYFVCGVVSGVEYLVESPDYTVIGVKFSANSQRYLLVGLGLIFSALICCAYKDWWNDRLSLLLTVIIPLVSYILGGMIRDRRKQMALFILMAIASAAVAIWMYVISVKTEYYPYGLFTEPISGNLVEKSVLIALWIPAVACLIGFTLYKIRFSKAITIVSVGFCCGVILLPQIRDGRLFNIKEALRLQLGMKSGLQWIASKENYYDLKTSHSMWLDFARDYGMVVFGLLIVFELWSCYCLVKVIRKKNRNLIDYVVIVAFVLFNYQFAFEATAVSSKYIFILGMFVFGIVAGRAGERSDS